MNRGTETTFELTTIERLEQLRYQHVFGPEIERAPDQIILKDAARKRINLASSDYPFLIRCASFQESR
jgi:hypothetical protein